MVLKLPNILKINRRPLIVVGVDLGISSVKIAVVKSGKVPQIMFCSIVEIPVNSTEDYVAEAIKKALKEAAMARKDAALTFGGDSVVFKRLELPPAIPAEEVMDALKLKAKDTVDFNIDEAYTSFKAVREAQKGSEEKPSGFIFAAVEKKYMDKKVRILKNAGLDVISVNLQPFGIENMLKSAVGTELPKTLMVVDIGFERVEMSVFEDRALQFVRSVSIGSNDITLALKEPMVTDKGEVRFSDKEAEDVKRSLGIAYDAVTLSEGLESVQALSLMRPVLENILKEIRRSIDYYIHEYGSDESISIYLTGSGSKLKNLDRYFREELNLPVDRLDPAHFISASESVLPKDDFVSIAAATGVAILGKNSMNFLPIEYKTAKVEFAEKAMLRMMVIVMVAVFGSLFLITKARIKDYEGRLKNVPAQIEFFGNIKELQEKVVAREEFLLKVKNSSLDIERIMREFSNVIPPGVVISSLSITSNGKSMNIIGVLYGHGKSSEGVLTKFMEDIEKSKCFKEAQLSFVQNQGGRADGSSSFQMECLLE